MSGEHLLCVDDDEDILELLAFDLGKQGYRVTCEASGQRVMELAAELWPDLIVLDVMLPMTSGLEICRQLKDDPRTRAIPIIMLSAKSAEDDVVAGFDSGADDYVTKPFSTKVLGTRIKALLRRESAGAPEMCRTIRVGEIVIEPVLRIVTVADQPVVLTENEFRLLYFLASKAGWAFTRAQIAEAVQGEENVVTDRAVDVQISGLRKKLGDLSSHVETVRGVGYRFKG